MLQKTNHRLLVIVSGITLIVVSFIIYQILFRENLSSSPLDLFHSNIRNSPSIIFSLEEESGRGNKVYAYETGEIIIRTFSFDLRQTIYRTKAMSGNADLVTVLQSLNLDISNLPAPGEYGDGAYADNEDFCPTAVAPYFYILTVDGDRYTLFIEGCDLMHGFGDGSQSQILHEFIEEANHINIDSWNKWDPNIYRIDFENFGCSGNDDFYETWPEQLNNFSFDRVNYIDSSWKQSELFQLDQHRRRSGMPILSDVCYWISLDGEEDYYRFDIEPLFPHEEAEIRQNYDIQSYR